LDHRQAGIGADEVSPQNRLVPRPDAGSPLRSYGRTTDCGKETAMRTMEYYGDAGGGCATLVAPVGYGDGPHRFERIGVAWAGDLEGEPALVHARRLALAHGARVIVRNVVRPPPYHDAGWGMTIQALDRGLRQRVRAWLSDVEVDVEAGFAPPRLELAAFSDEVDLLICGPRLLRTLGRLEEHSIGDYLAGHCTCPVLIVPARPADPGSFPPPLEVRTSSVDPGDDPAGRFEGRGGWPGPHGVTS
jgi:nucleotide-binding universal stress UspA family protein